MRKLNSLKLLLSALLLAIGCNVWGEKVSIASWTYASRAANTAYNPSTSDANNSSAILKSECALTTAGSGGSSSAYYGSWTNGKAILISGLSMTGYVNNSIVLTINLRHRNSGTASFYYSTDGTSYPSTANATKSITNTSTDYEITSIPNNVKTIKVVISGKTAGNLWLGNVTIEGEKAASNPYTVTFNVGSNGSFASGETFDAGTTDQRTEASAGAGVALPNVTANENYAFKGWSTANPATATTLVSAGADGKYHPSANTPLYAYYVATYTLTITQPAAGGTLTVKNGETPLATGATVEVGTNLTCEVTNIPEGKRFSRFYAKWDNDEDKYKATNPATFDNIATEDITACEIYVTYMDKKNVTVNFYGVNNELISTATKFEGSEFDVPSNPNDVLEYSFVGWAESAVSTETTTKPDFVEFATTTFTASKDKNYYAVYTKKIGSGETYTITKDNVPSAYNTSGESVTINGKVFVMTSVACFSRYSNNIQFAKNTSSITTNEDLAANITSIELTYATTNSNRDLTVNVNGNISPSINGNVYTFDCSSKNSKQFTIANSTSNTDNLDLIVITCGSSTSYYTSTIVTAYTRSVTEGNYGTICLPYGVAADAYSGATIYNVGGVTKQGDAITGIVLVEEEGALVAGKPYIFQASANEIVLTYSGEPAGVQPANGLMGNLGEEMTIKASESIFYYVLSGTTLYHLAGTSTATIGKNKAYLNLEGIEVYQAPAQTQSRVAVIPVNGQPTALENSALNAEVKKVVIDGQMMILRDGNMFDLNGRLVK